MSFSTKTELEAVTRAEAAWGRLPDPILCHDSVLFVLVCAVMLPHNL